MLLGLRSTSRLGRAGGGVIQMSASDSTHLVQRRRSGAGDPKRASIERLVAYGSLSGQLVCGARRARGGVLPRARARRRPAFACAPVRVRTRSSRITLPGCADTSSRAPSARPEPAHGRPRRDIADIAREHRPLATRGRCVGGLGNAFVRSSVRTRRARGSADSYHVQSATSGCSRTSTARTVGGRSRSADRVVVHPAALPAQTPRVSLARSSTTATGRCRWGAAFRGAEAVVGAAQLRRGRSAPPPARAHRAGGELGRRVDEHPQLERASRRLVRPRLLPPRRRQRPNRCPRGGDQRAPDLYVTPSAIGDTRFVRGGGRQTRTTADDVERMPWKVIMEPPSLDSVIKGSWWWGRAFVV